MICDAHINIGFHHRKDGKWFSYSPRRICSILRKFDVDEFIYSSMSMAVGNKRIEAVHKEVVEMQKLFGSGAHPFLLVTPLYLYSDPHLSILRYGFYEGVNLEAYGHWHVNEEKLECVLAVVEELKKPIMIYTSYDFSASRFLPAIKRHPNVRFNLAHGCPLRETLNCLRESENVFVDISGMSDAQIDYLATRCVREYGNRILWGTNFPATAVRHGESLAANMRRNIELCKELSEHVDFVGNFRRYLRGE